MLLSFWSRLKALTSAEYFTLYIPIILVSIMAIQHESSQFHAEIIAYWPELMNLFAIRSTEACSPPESLQVAYKYF